MLLHILCLVYLHGNYVRLIRVQYNDGFLPDIILTVDPILITLGNPIKSMKSFCLHSLYFLSNYSFS